MTFLEGTATLGKVTATVNAISEISISPTTLVLPRYEGGKPVYSGWFYCRSRSGKPFEIISDVVSFEIKVSIDRPDVHSDNSYKIGLTFIGSPPTSSTKKFDLIFKVKNESGERSLVAHVMIGQADE